MLRDNRAGCGRTMLKVLPPLARTASGETVPFQPPTDLRRRACGLTAHPFRRANSIRPLSRHTSNSPIWRQIMPRNSVHQSTSSWRLV